MNTNKTHTSHHSTHSLYLAFFISVGTSIMSVLTSTAGHTDFKKTIGLYQLDNTSATASVQKNDTDNIVYSTYTSATTLHVHSFTYGSGSYYPETTQPYITTLYANTPKEAFNLIPSHTFNSVQLSGAGLTQQTQTQTLVQQQTFAHGYVYNHGNLGEIKTKIRQVYQPATIFARDRNKTQADISLLFGQDLTLNTNNKVLITAEIIARNLSDDSFRHPERSNSENNTVFSMLFSNNTWLRKQIAVTITQPEHQAATLSASLIYFLYGPRFFSIHDIHHPRVFSANLDPLIANA